MTVFVVVLALVVGFLLGRLYGWMKYHYPEFQEDIKLKTATKRADRMREEARAERHRSEIDDELDRRMNA